MDIIAGNTTKEEIDILHSFYEEWYGKKYF